jgi:hypothetical protein
MSDDGDSGQSFTMPAERGAHRERSLTGVAVNEHVSGKAQCSDKPSSAIGSAGLRDPCRGEVFPVLAAEVIGIGLRAQVPGVVVIHQDERFADRQRSVGREDRWALTRLT